MCTRGSVWGILNYFCEGLCLNQTSCLWDSAPIWVTRLCAALIGSEIQKRDTERGKKERVRLCYSLSLHLLTVKPKARDLWEKRMRLLRSSPLTPASHSTLNQPSCCIFPGSYLTRNYWSSTGLNYTLLILWGVVFSLWGDVLTGAGPEDPWLPGADRLAPLQV